MSRAASSSFRGCWWRVGLASLGAQIGTWNDRAHGIGQPAEHRRWWWRLVDSFASWLFLLDESDYDRMVFRAGTWRCECGDINGGLEAFCSRCGAGPEEDA